MLNRIKIKSACSRILGIEVSITRDVISPGGPTCPIATIIGFS